MRHGGHTFKIQRIPPNEAFRPGLNGAVRRPHIKTMHYATARPHYSNSVHTSNASVTCPLVFSPGSIEFYNSIPISNLMVAALDDERNGGNTMAAGILSYYHNTHMSSRLEFWMNLAVRKQADVFNALNVR